MPPAIANDAPPVGRVPDGGALTRDPDAFDGTPGQLAAFQLAESYLALACFRCGGKVRRMTRALTVKRPFAFACPKCRTRSAWEPLNSHGVLMASRRIRYGIVVFDYGIPKGGA